MDDMDGLAGFPGTRDDEAGAGAFCPSVAPRVIPATLRSTLLYSDTPLPVSA